MSDEEEGGDAEVNIQTFLRIRPSKTPSGYFQKDELEDTTLKVNLPDSFKTADYINNSKLNHVFQFSGIIPMEATQEDVFKKVGVPAIKNALEGFNSTIFAYGQTGSGKTFTLTGSAEKYSERGLIPRSLSMLFREFRTRTDFQFKPYISYLEIYNETGHDLLDPSYETKSLDEMKKVMLLEDEHGNYHLKNLSMHPAENEEDALNLLFMGDTNRAIAETSMNKASSRSHCIFTISIEGRSVGTDKIRRSKLHLVDLAGSERVSKTNSSGAVLKEAGYINSSLFYLENVIVALYEKATKGRSHIPYRNSMMTSVLRDSLGGNCKTIMIATVNPEASHSGESLSTCRFAQRVSLIKNKAMVNEDLDPALVIRRLKNDMLVLREEIAFLKGEAGEGEPLTAQAVEDLKTQCRQYCDNPDPHCALDIGQLTLTKIKDVFAMMKNLVLEARASGGGVSSSASSTTDPDLARQIKELKGCLLQRDNEIAILVNMVKKGKTAEDVTRASSSQWPVSPANRGDGCMSSGGSGGGGGGGSVLKSTVQKLPMIQQQPLTLKALQQQQQRERDANRDELIVARHLFGVPPPTDPEIFENSAASFSWFSERCSSNAALEENKELLRSMIEEAKVVGATANQSRGTINYLKTSIESLRREKALQGLSSMIRPEEASEEGASGAGSAAEESSEEATLRKAIDQEKQVYIANYERLKVLKPEIENLRKVLEKGRSSMQTQFEQWYSNLHSRDLVLGAGDPHASVSASASVAQQPLDSKDTSAVPRNRNVLMSVTSNRSEAKERDSRRADGADYKTIDSNSLATNSMNAPQLSSISQSKEVGDVNDDITAFFQAKEQLLKLGRGR